MSARRVWILLVVSFLGAAAAQARGGAGATGGSILLVPVSARVAAFSGACQALGGVDALNCNPAGLRALAGRDVGLSYQRGLADDDFAVAQWGQPAGAAAWGASLLYWDTGKIDLVDDAGNSAAKTGKRDFVFTAGLARDFWSVPLGVSAKAISSEIFGEKAAAVAVSVGARRAFGEGVAAGLSWNNVGSGLKYVSEEDPLPQNVGGGLAFTRRLGRCSALVTGDYAYYAHERKARWRAGGEVGYGGVGFLRAGFASDDDAWASDSFNLGLGVIVKKYKLDYAVDLSGDLDVQHRMTLGFRL